MFKTDDLKIRRQIAVAASLLFIGLACLIASPPSRSQTLLMTGAGKPSPGGASFVGPGDVVGGAFAWWGLRAYSSATRGNALINVCNVSDVVCADLFSNATTGALVITTIGGSNCSVVVCTIKTWYDQTGNTNNQTQTTIGNRAVLTPSCIGSLPCATFTRSSTQGYGSTTSPTDTAAPWTISGVFNFNASNGSSWFTMVTPLIALQRTFTTNQISFYDNANVQNATANDLSWHAGQYVSNAASSVLYVDGTANTGTTMDSSAASINQTHLGGEPTFNTLDGKLVEAGLWPSAFSSPNQSTMNTNQHTFWGF